MVGLSVVVVTRDRGPLLETTLSHLAIQTLDDGSPFEIVVVDSSENGSVRPREEPRLGGPLLRAIRDLDGRPIPRSAAIARNIGARAAAGSRLLFLDDDMLASRGLLSVHLACASDEVLLGYRFLAGPSTALPPPGTKFVPDETWAADERQDYLQANGDRPDWGCLYSHCFSMSRDAFLRVGGFDETFEGCGGEDVEFGYRAHLSGLRFRLSRHAALHQFHERSPQRWRDNAANLERLTARHPELAEFGEAVRRGWERNPSFLQVQAEGPE